MPESEGPKTSRGNLLTHVITTVGARQAEDLTTASLVYLLTTYGKARTAFISLLREVTGIDLPDDLWFEFQASQGGFRVPDIAAVDVAGLERVLIEAKLNAGLGTDQARDYFERLPPQCSSALCLLAPERRLPSLWLDASAQIEDFDDMAIRGPKRRASKGSKVLAALSWTEVITVLKEALGASSSEAGEISQLEGVIEYFDQRAFIPFSGDELSVSSGELFHRFPTLVDRVIQACREQMIFTDIGARSAGSVRGIFYGCGVRISGWPAWFGLWTRTWVELAETPLWLQFKDRSIVPGKAMRAFAGLDVTARSRVFERAAERDVAVALFVPTGASEKRTISEIVDQIHEVATCIAEHGGPVQEKTTS